MGNTHLGRIPTTESWTAVVERVSTRGSSTDRHGGIAGPALLPEDVSAIAQRTLEAAAGGLERAVGDNGLSFTFFLLTQVALASREADWIGRLRQLGMDLSGDSSCFDLIAEIQLAVDRHVQLSTGPTDISEMAQKAAGAAIIELVGPKSQTLFGRGIEELQEAVRDCSTKTGFAKLGQRFFGRFLARFLNFYLSRITAAEAGSAAFQQVGDIACFDEALETHCEQIAVSVREFSGAWYSKTNYESGIDAEKTSRFMAIALRKLQGQLLQQEGNT